MTARNKRQIGYAISFVTILAALTAAGGSYLLSYALRPEAFIRERTASARESMLRQYPFLGPWIDSLEQHGALRDTVIRGQEGERLHAVYAPAPNPTSRTAVIVHGYTDCAERMLMIGYLYHHDLGFNILLPDLHYHGESEGRAIIAQILSESFVLTFIAGVLGLSAAVGVLSVADSIYYQTVTVAQEGAEVSWMISFGTGILALAILVGGSLLAGVIPAARALNIKAVDAIREE